MPNVLTGPVPRAVFEGKTPDILVTSPADLNSRISAAASLHCISGFAPEVPKGKFWEEGREIFTGRTAGAAIRIAEASSLPTSGDAQYVVHCNIAEGKTLDFKTISLSGSRAEMGEVINGFKETQQNYMRSREKALGLRPSLAPAPLRPVLAS